MATLFLHAFIRSLYWVCGTLVPVYISDHVSANKQGRLMGLMMGFRSLGDVEYVL